MPALCLPSVDTMAGGWRQDAGPTPGAPDSIVSEGVAGLASLWQGWTGLCRGFCAPAAWLSTEQGW
jgi:hypothetical protein